MSIRTVFHKEFDARAGESTRRTRPFWLAALAALLALAAVAGPAPAQAQQNPSKASLSRLVVVGDSISAGFQNGSLLDSQQVHGYANLIARQAGTPLVLPLIAPPGIPNVLELVSVAPLKIVPAPGSSTGRDNPFVQVTDLAVPGAKLHDALATVPSFPIDDLTDLILGLPGLLLSPPVSLSQVQWAEALQPTTIIVWLGNNDALGAAIATNPGLLTPVPQFEADYTVLMSRLAATGATIVVANVPDVTVLPFFTSAEKVAALVGIPLDIIGPILGIGPGDFVTPDAFPLIQADVLAFRHGEATTPLPPNVVLTAADVVQIRTAVDAYNSIIAQQAAAVGAAVVDTHALLNLIQANGFVVNGQRLTTDFLGGLFSLDGIHPTNTGYAVVANEFIKRMNTSFAAGIPPVAVELVAATDPLVLPGVGRPASALGQISNDTVNSLRAILAH